MAAKLVVKITVDKDADPELYQKLLNVHVKRRSETVRQLACFGLTAVMPTPLDEPAQAPIAHHQSTNTQSDHPNDITGDSVAFPYLASDLIENFGSHTF